MGKKFLSMNSLAIRLVDNGKLNLDLYFGIAGGGIGWESMVLIIIGVLILLVIIALAVFCFAKKCKEKFFTKKESEEDQ